MHPQNSKIVGQTLGNLNSSHFQSLFFVKKTFMCVHVNVECIQGRHEGERAEKSPGAPKSLRDCEMTAGEPKSPVTFTTTFFNTVHFS